jgi:nicotinate-nucleotide--dimethylbenzimidazole phosphoribosyltransferase
MSIDTDAQSAMDQKTKPVGSLGRLEALAVQLCAVQNTLMPQVDPVRVLIFAADHGVAAEGVSLYPAAVTAQMMANFAAGGAAISVLTRCFAMQHEIIDVGVNADLSGLAGVINAKVAHGSANLRHRPALSPSQLLAAMAVGAQAVQRAERDGVKTLVLGEMGIANTTAAAALVCAYTGHTPADVVGAGTGVSGAALAQKIAVVSDALARVGANRAANELLGELGGLEIAALTGAMLAAEQANMIVLVDGFIVTAAALAAVAMAPNARRTMVFAHRSAERGHQLALAALGATPLLDLAMRLGEGSGAALAVPLLRAASALMCEMASFASAGVATAGAATAE